MQVVHLQLPLCQLSELLPLIQPQLAAYFQYLPQDLSQFSERLHSQISDESQFQALQEEFLSSVDMQSAEDAQVLILPPFFVSTVSEPLRPSSKIVELD